MHPDPHIVLWPDFQEFYRWLCQEVDGLTDAELDFDSHDPAHEWMWWSIRRQVSHMHFTFEASLWMLYYEVLTHLYTIKRLKRARGLPTWVVIPRVAYLTLPEFTGEAVSPGPSFVPLR